MRLTEAGAEVAPSPGLLVADFSCVLAGPFGTTTLADLGAEVIKVERPDGLHNLMTTPATLKGSLR